ncbi:MAG: diguanylate cyclase, partial [Candidatus Obscuribacterales bacterium]
FNLDCCFVVLPSEDEPEDSIRSEYYADEEYQLMQQDVDLRTLEVFKQHFQGEQLLMANDAAHDRRLEPFRKDALPNYHFFSLFFVPITYEQKLLGLLGGYKCESQANWNRDNEAFLKSVADQVATGVTNARLYARVQRQATTDGLTGLYNHRTGQEKLAEQLRLAERYQRNLAVVMLDVDHFKSINDNYGHPAGDSVLKAVAKLVKSNCRDVDLPVRYGGEEFLVVLPEVNQEGAAVVAERIRKSLSQEIIHHEDIQISVTGSFGIAAFPEDAHNQQHLLDLADKALYLSKRLGRNQVHTAGDLMFEEISPSKPPEQPPRADTQRKNEAESSADETTEKSGQEKDVSPPAVVTNSGQFTLPQNTYADFVPTAVSAAAEQKEELVPEVVDMVKALATALYSKSDYNKQHHLETARLSELLAKVMGLSQQQVEQIRVAGLLHDVGTLSIPADLINKPGKYNADEREIINQHAVLGAQLLRPIRALRDICEILENHHERWDGTGYPRGLKGEEIPLPARIVSIVDSYHAMISDRPYRPAMTREQAIQTLKNGAGLQWDPFLVDIFVAVLASLNDPRSAPLSAPTPATPRVEALTNDQSKPAPQAASNSAQSLSVPTTEQSADSSVNQSPLESAETASHTVEKVEDDGSEQPVLNARQRLLQHSQQHQPLQLAQQDSSASGDRTDASETPSRPASDIDTSDNLTPVSGNISVTAQVSSGREIDDLKDEEFGESEDEEQDDDDDDDYEDEDEDEASPASLSPTTQSAQPQGTPSALEQLRRIPPEQQAAIFHQASQRANELPAHAQQGLAPQRSDSQAPVNPATPVQAAPTHTAPQPAPAQTPTQAPSAMPHTPATPVVQNASALFSRAPYDASAQRPQPLPQQQAPGQNISQPLPQQPAPGQHISQPLPQQPAPAQHISQPLPQQPAPAQHSQPMPQPQAPAQHISQPLPQQQASGQHISQPLPQQQASGQHISQPLPQQQAPAQHISQPLPQQPQPNSQFSQQQRAFPSPTQNQQQAAQQPSSAAQPVTPNTVPQPTAPQTPQTHNLFPHLQQLQNQPGQNPAVWQQPYASQSPYANPPEQKPASQPAQQELSAQQPTAEQDSEQFYEEP